MHAMHILLQRLRAACPVMHLRRLQALLACVSAALRARRLTVTELGRALPGQSRAKHGIKRADRLAGNIHFAHERLDVYAAIARWLLGDAQRPIIIIDWSDVARDRQWQLLRAAVPVGGRTLTLYEEVHPLKRLANPRVHAAFLRRLKAVLPESVVPIMITDAGFRTPWFRAVSKLGWHYIGRIRNRDGVRAAGATAWISCKSLYPKANRQARALGPYELVRGSSIDCRLYLIKHPKKHRVHKSVYGKPMHSSESRARARMQSEPWLLAASPSLEELSATDIVAFYAKRMQIEEAFRDLKCTRYGMGFELHRSRDCKRVAALLLIASLALLVLWLIGMTARTNGLQHHYQSNTRRTRPVLSVFYLACLHLRHCLYSSPPRLPSILPALLASPDCAFDTI